MIYKNVEFHNVENIIQNEDGSVSWRRVPDCVYEILEAPNGKRMAGVATGVEIRFVIKSGQATLRMSVKEGEGTFHVYRGAIQGGYQDHEVHKHVGTTPDDYVISIDEHMDSLKTITKDAGYDWDAEVVRIIFDRGSFKIHDITGDIEPPKKSQTPSKCYMAYGSSITHGSNSIDSSHSWVSLIAHNLNMDERNLGMAGSCWLEPEFAEFIASEGEKGNWDVATLELGANALGWEEDKIRERVSNLVSTVALRNKDKKIFVISPFYYSGDRFGDEGRGAKWRRVISAVLDELNYENVTYINGTDVIDSMEYISADMVHPNIYGAAKIADKLTEIIKSRI